MLFFFSFDQQLKYRVLPVPVDAFILSELETLSEIEIRVTMRKINLDISTVQ